MKKQEGEVRCMTRRRESVWDYPRPPCVEPESRRVTVTFAGVLVADSRNSLRVLETSHPPSFYIPASDVNTGVLEAATAVTYCEWKGAASHWDLRVGTSMSLCAAWCYERPRRGYELLRDHFAFYPGRVDRCTVGDEQATAQPGDFYGGWITPDIHGPVKGAPGTETW
ncbi:DUF427 domain-containing protein [Streptomyces wuyuanensis]|uniref:DUF427 domain-containing protein n=1 Tax=Streptomyces wuyuanensis TaxID=1196353 RepID=UPI003827E4E9